MEKDYVKNTEKDASQYVTGVRLAAVMEVARGLLDRGWSYFQYTGSEGTYSANWVKGTRRIEFTLRTEWERFSEPRTAVFVDAVKVKHKTDATKELSIPVDGDYMVHVWRDDPLATATALDLCTDEELWEQYAPSARANALSAALSSGAADILRELK